MKTYIGVKIDNGEPRVFVVSASGVDEAFLRIGDFLFGKRLADAGDVDLDFFGKLPHYPVYGDGFEVHAEK